MITTAFLQHSGNGPMRHEESLLAEGLRRRGIPVQHYTIKRIHRRRLPLRADTLIAGDMDAMHGAMRQLRIPIPVPDDYPISLREFLRRRVWVSTLGEIERELDTGSAPATFVKPADRRKSFTGAICYSERDVAAFGNVSRRQRVWCSEVVRWAAEYRVYVVDQRIVAIDHYDGEPTTPLDMKVVTAAITTYRNSGTAPAAYGIDFGVLTTGETALVEANDGYALGAYAIDADSYTELIMRRWAELLESAKP
ncbi:ATP-grasp domain-containing protein [Nocardia sp. NBC_01503]|uniref:ATP-grasp domain-containing protein n=1 Tax=Nocardia sp. NBC_01503 TaxID=2975997 RepID=UPI002E7BB2E4|nr:ATP-grasp domain-containing protein [Nocardia sp. NBC_01503]WTL30824.1 ATP-grasp domain-containing protein [Nocardia sp. NBC_01503]